MVIVALISATIPVSKADTKVEESEPLPSTEISAAIVLAVATPTLATVQIGKSLADEQREREEAEKAAQAAKLKAEKEAERMKHLAAAKELAQQRYTQKQGEYVKIIGNSREQCVIYAKRITGNAKIRGYAGDLVSEGQEPKVGAAALERNYGHVSVVIAIEGDYLILHDANWDTGHITERRVHKSTQRGYIY